MEISADHIRFGATGRCSRRHFLQRLGVACAGSLAVYSAPASGAARAVRIATPDRAGTQSVLALGMVPIAAVSRSLYDGMGCRPPLPQSVVDCGEPVEPNLEVLRRANIDFIVTSTIGPDIRDVLQRVAPVFPLEIYTGKPGTLDRAKNETLRLAQALGIESAGRAYLEVTDRLLTISTDRLRGLQFRQTFLVGLASDGRSMTVYGRNSIMYDVMANLGIENAWHDRTTEYGFANVGIEELAKDPQANILHIDYGTDTDIALTKLSVSPFWNALPMVRERRVHRISRFEVFGGLPAAPQFATAVADALLKSEPR
ncbi:MAG: hypothetical protein E6Q76_00960 [Rhizobium sp.]|nr:MAG: hypothetical protein E6Q76_00960 [Rhizobium sp.]